MQQQKNNIKINIDIDNNIQINGKKRSRLRIV